MRPALGECLARLAAAMPVAFLEPQLNEYNACSVYTTKSPRERASKWCGAKAASGVTLSPALGFGDSVGQSGLGGLRIPQVGGAPELVGRTRFVVWTLRSGGTGWGCPDSSLHPSPGAPQQRGGDVS